MACLYHELDLSPMDMFKVFCSGKLVDDSNGSRPSYSITSLFKDTQVDPEGYKVIQDANMAATFLEDFLEEKSIYEEGQWSTYFSPPSSFYYICSHSHDDYPRAFYVMLNISLKGFSCLILFIYSSIMTHRGISLPKFKICYSCRGPRPLMLLLDDEGSA